MSASGIEELIDAPAPAGISPSEYGKPGTDVIIRLQDRVTMYKEAIDNAKSNSDTSKERRLGRGLKVGRYPGALVMVSYMYGKCLKSWK